MDEQTWNTCSKYAHALFNLDAKGQTSESHFGRHEVQFGIDTDGTVCLIDELHTPDSSRYWVKHSYQERFDSVSNRK